MDRNILLQGSIPKHILRLAIPSIIGMMSFTIFNFTDTYFVSQLGTDALAAMGFTFPIVMVVGAISSGIAMGAASMVSRAMGASNKELMQSTATNGILLSLLIVSFISLIGIFTMDPLFKLLGAEDNVLSLVKDYMFIWYISVIVVVTPPVSDSSMRAKGDMIRPLVVMLICAILNIILDPFLIHGYWIFPALGIRGAALATVIARSFGMVATLFFISQHHKLLSIKVIKPKYLRKTWASILRIGIPNIAILLVPQLLRTLLTYLVSDSGGDTAVAAIAVGTRVESFVTIITAGVGMALVPIIGQNYGAGFFDRVEATRKFAIRFALIYGFIVFLLFIPLASPLASIFTKESDIINYSTYYLWIMIFGMMGLNVTNWMSQAFTTVGKPLYTVLLNVIGVIIITMPSLLIGYFLYGYIGLLVGLCIGQLILGFLSGYISKSRLLSDTFVYQD